MTMINKKAPFQKQLLEMSNAIEDLNHRIPEEDQFYTKEESDALYQTQEGMSDYFTKTQSNDKFLEKAALTDYSIDHIIAGNSEIDNDAVDLRAVYSQDVKSEVSLDPNSIIIRTMSGTDVSTFGISATEIDLTTSMLKYNNNEVATKTDLNSKQDTLVSGTNIKTIGGQSLLGSGNITIPGIDSHLYSCKIVQDVSNGRAVANFIFSSAVDQANAMLTVSQFYNKFGNTYVSASGSLTGIDNTVKLASPIVNIDNSGGELLFNHYDSEEGDWTDFSISFTNVSVNKLL